MRPTNPLLRWFDYSHLPAHLRGGVEPFRTLALGLDDQMSGNWDVNHEFQEAIRKLLEAKDCAVRGAVLAHESAPAARAEQVEDQYS